MTSVLLRLCCKSSPNTLVFNRYLLRRMSNDHLQRTSDNSREKVLSEATIEDIKELSPSTKQLVLKVDNPTLSFKPGQWVDFFITGIDTVGGFSICSTPSQLTHHKILTLAVKFSDHPPAFWVHKDCTIGTKVKVRIGGDFLYDPSPLMDQRDLLLIAGGLGVNPLVSILGHVSEMYSIGDKWKKRLPFASLLYSAANRSELLFKNKIDEITKWHGPHINASYFVTKEFIAEEHKEDTVQCQRIDADAIDGVLSDFDVKTVQCFLCGPPPMIEDLENVLIMSGVEKMQIHYENWW